MYKRILYTSRAASDTTMRSVYDIIRTSHNRNSESGLTGCLLFIDGYFIQVLEGAPYAVDERYQRILIDLRHEDATLRLCETSTVLLFPSEWMALRDGSEVDPATLMEHDYEIGLPVERFSGQRVLEFVSSCFAASVVH